MLTYEEACEVVFSAKKFGICLGLERMELLLEALGNPEKQIRAIHLAGTNGKGSTLTYIAAILTEAGYTVGTYTSPAINKINDKIKINGEEISDDDFALIIETLKPIIEKISETRFGPPTEFEILTAVAFQYFAIVKKTDFVVVETGLGGRLDSTNVITPLLSIITTIGHDHMDILGDTIAKVTYEKAGIIKPSVPVISGCKQEEAKLVIKNRAEEESAELYQLGEEFSCEHDQQTFTFTFKQRHYANLKTGMLGVHQQENASLALMALYCLQQNNHLKIDENQLRNGLAKAQIANRIEMVQQQPTIIFDGGHNPEGMEALSNTLASSFSDKRITVLFCAMKDKDIPPMLDALTTIATEIILTSFPFERVMDPHEVYHAYPHRKLKVTLDWEQAYRDIINHLAENDVFVITGSLYFLNHVRTNVHL